jgi:hypothetical protein
MFASIHPEKLLLLELVEKLLRLLWSLKVYYRVRKSPPLDHILSHFNPIHTLTSSSIVR